MGRGEQGVGLSQNLGNEGDLGCLGAFSARVWGRGGRTCHRNSNNRREPFPPQGSQGTSGAEMQQKPLLDLFYPSVSKGAERGHPFPCPAHRQFLMQQVCRLASEKSAALQRLAGAAAHPSAPFLHFSSAGSDCSS